MASSGMLRRVALVRTFLRSVRCLLVAANVLTDSFHHDIGALLSSETSVLTGATRRNIPEDGILHTHRRENLNSYIALTGCAL
jgi:hypothetical protein